jgi:hypothetical protein
MFRHSYGAHLYRMGFALPVIAKLLDHESLSTTEIYADTDADMANEAFNPCDRRQPMHRMLWMKRNGNVSERTHWLSCLGWDEPSKILS